jgi:signal peptidase I
MLGDNSNFSMDSRYFGPVPRRNLVGRAWVVFYPFSRRMGLVDHPEALPMPTGEAGESTFKPMFLQ